MPHTIYLGSGLVQPRMRDLDKLHNRLHEVRASESKFAMYLYRPTLSTIKSCLSYTIAELCITLFIVAIFINSAVLIVAGASFSSDASNADLPGLYRVFVDTLGYVQPPSLGTFSESVALKTLPWSADSRSQLASHKDNGHQS